MNVRKQAAKDAFEFARAQMFYGEGAGTRRKLIKAQVEHRIATIPGYAQAYNNAMLAQDMVEHAEKARKMRKNIDRSSRCRNRDLLRPHDRLRQGRLGVQQEEVQAGQELGARQADRPAYS
jgi:hypothetical protein